MFHIYAMTTLGWLALVVVWVLLAFWPARVAGRKGHSFFGYFIFSLLLGLDAQSGAALQGRAKSPRAADPASSALC